jgi:hypothetical protein
LNETYDIDYDDGDKDMLSAEMIRPLEKTMQPSLDAKPELRALKESANFLPSDKEKKVKIATKVHTLLLSLYTNLKSEEGSQFAPFSLKRVRSSLHSHCKLESTAPSNLESTVPCHDSGVTVGGNTSRLGIAVCPPYQMAVKCSMMLTTFLSCHLIKLWSLLES